MDDKNTAAPTPGGCTHNCSTCAPNSCDSDKKKGISFFGTLNNISEHTDKLSDEELMQILQDAVDEWEEQ